MLSEQRVSSYLFPGTYAPGHRIILSLYKNNSTAPKIQVAHPIKKGKNLTLPSVVRRVSLPFSGLSFSSEGNGHTPGTAVMLISDTAADLPAETGSRGKFAAGEFGSCIRSGVSRCSHYFHTGISVKEHFNNFGELRFKGAVFP